MGAGVIYLVVNVGEEIIVLVWQLEQLRQPGVRGHEVDAVEPVLVAVVRRVQRQDQPVEALPLADEAEEVGARVEVGAPRLPVLHRLLDVELQQSLVDGPQVAILLERVRVVKPTGADLKEFSE